MLWTRTAFAISLVLLSIVFLLPHWRTDLDTRGLPEHAAEEVVRVDPPQSGPESGAALGSDEPLAEEDPLAPSPAEASAAPEALADEIDDEGTIDITTSEGMERAEQRQQRRRIAALRKEAPDPDWSPRAERDLYTAFVPSKEMGATVADLACGSSFCRVDIELRDGEDVDSRILELITLIPWNTKAFYEPEEPDSSRGSIYFTREGVADFGRSTTSSMEDR